MVNLRGVKPILENPQGKTSDAAEHRGAILVLMALMTTVIIGLIGFAVDYALVAASKSQQEHTASYAALGALEAYLADIKVPTHDTSDHLAAAAAQASAVANINLELSVSKAQLKDIDAQRVPIPAAAPGETGSIEPGRWYFDEPYGKGQCGAYVADYPSAGTGSCPCPSGTWNGACFQSIDLSTTSPNAMKVTLKLSNASPIRSIFAQVMGLKSWGLASTEIAAIVPRQGVFMVDISNSLTEDTHEGQIGATNPKFYSTMANQALTCSDFPSTDYATFHEGTNFVSENDADVYYDLLNQAPPEIEEGDYQCITINDSGDDTLTTQHYLVDTQTAPEPLTSILQGIYTALGRFKDRAVVGDSFGVLAFDDDFLPTRSTVKDWDPVHPELNRSPVMVNVDATDADSEWNKFRDATNASDSETIANVESRLARKFLIPRGLGSTLMWNGAALERRAPFSDVTKALIEARRMLNENREFQTADRFVVLFSDGLANCLQNYDGAPMAEPTNDTDMTRCESSRLDYFSAALAESLAELSAYRDEKIALHFFIAGKSVNPHTVLRKAGDHCMTDAEARDGGFDYVESETLVGVPTPTTLSSPYPAAVLFPDPFYGPNSFYSSVKSTGGFWVPLREPCDGSGTAMVDDLDAKCAATAGPDGTAVTIGASPPQFADGSSALVGSRLLCDPSGLTKGQQVSEKILKIMEKSPFVLVK